jgi:hypothetical protein
MAPVLNAESPMFKTPSSDSCEDAICKIPLVIPGSKAADFTIVNFAVLSAVVICAFDVPPKRMRLLIPPISIGFAGIRIDDVAKLMSPVVLAVNKATLSEGATLLYILLLRPELKVSTAVAVSATVFLK